MALFRCLVTVAALCSFSASASALTVQECQAQYKDDHAAGVRQSWVDYQKKRCGIDPKAAPTAAPARPGSTERVDSGLR